MTGVLDDYLTREEVARQLRVTTQTLARWANARRGPVFIMVGARCMYSRAAVQGWIDDLEDEAKRNRAPVRLLRRGRA